MAKSQPQRARVLVVDDNDHNLVAMGATLESLGDELVFARSGPEALRALLQGDFAVILLDVQMPQMSGLETASLIRMRERTRLVPIILFTAYAALPELVAKGYEHGAVDYLIKPVEPEILRAKVWFFAELWRRGRKLEEHARELARAEAAQDEARESAEFERRMLGIVGHDLRSPLSAVKMGVHRLLKEGPLQNEQRRVLERISRSTLRMEQLTALFMDVTRARIGGGIPLSPSRTDLREVIQNVLEEMQTAHPDRAVTLSTDDGDGVGFWDPARLHQIFINLLTNAVRYGDPAKPVTITANLTGPMLSLSVHNAGPAISPALQSQLFEPFTRGGTNDQASPGSLGLGLYIVRQLVQNHGGEISVRSTPEEGTTFTVILPRLSPKFDEDAAHAVG